MQRLGLEKGRKRLRSRARQPSIDQIYSLQTQQSTAKRNISLAWQTIAFAELYLLRLKPLFILLSHCLPSIFSFHFCLQWFLLFHQSCLERFSNKQNIVDLRMNKRNSHKKLNGEILLMQNQLMSKLANLSQPKKLTDQLGFNLYQPKEESDALLNLISKSKNITKNHARQIEMAKKTVQKEFTKRKVETEGTFLTGLGLSKQNQAQRSRKEIPAYDHCHEQESDPDSMLKDLINKKSNDDLQQLRRMIKQTGSNLQGCSRKLNKSKKNIMQMADRYSNEVPIMTMQFLNNYKEFQLKKLEEVRYY